MYSRSSSVLLDFQYLLGRDKEIVVKELAFMMADSIVPHMYHFEPPYQTYELTSDVKRQNNFCKFKINMLDWNSGDTPYSTLATILTELEKTGHTVFVHSVEKKKFLQKFLTHVELVPAIRSFGREYLFKHNCPIHDPGFGRCALLHIFIIKIFMEKKEIFE